MISKIATRNGKASGARAFHAIPAAIGAAAVIVSLIAATMIAASFGRSEAADAATQGDAAKPAEITLAGRWTGQYYGYGRREAKDPGCAGNGCSLTYDVVACNGGWCGIVVKDGGACGPVGVRLAADRQKEGTDEHAFKGKLELAKGAAPYTVEAWFGNDDGKPTLHFLGDTGSELLMMRRSFPFEANLERVADATCTMDKATS